MICDLWDVIYYFMWYVLCDWDSDFGCGFTTAGATGAAVVCLFRTVEPSRAGAGTGTEGEGNIGLLVLVSVCDPR